MDIRPAVATDLPLISRLAGNLVRMHYDADRERFFLPEDVERGYEWWFSRELSRGAAVILVACDPGVIGYAYGSLEPRDWNMLLDEHGAIHDVYVEESARRSGTGKRLVTALVAALEAKGAERVVLSTMVRNEAAQRVFAACGFKPTMLEMTRARGRGGAV